MCLQQDESQASHVGLLSGLENRCLNIFCEGLDGPVFCPRPLPTVMQKMYVSRVPDSQAWETDALNISWEGLVSYVFCPVALIPQVIQQMTTYRCRIIMIARGWPGMSWLSDLVNLSTKLPLSLPLWVNLLSQPFSNRLHNNLAYLNLHA